MSLSAFSRYYNAFAFALLHPSYAIRKRAQEVLCKLSGVANLSIDLLKSIGAFLDNHSRRNATLTSFNEKSSVKFGKALCESLLILASVKNLKMHEIESIALESLSLANNALAKRVNINLYEKCLNKLVDENKLLNNSLAVEELVQRQCRKY